MIVLAIITILLIGETNAQFGFNSFNRNIAGDNSLNNNLNLNPRPSPGQPQPNQPAQPQPNQPGQSQQSPFLPALGGFILGTAFGRSLRYPYGYYPYYYYPYYYPYYYRG
ncbi:unnamed protein product [Acanthocheilonema viteae]|uniref:Uncharacterized protein n=1 Tax=Acanthocheilonema viteae TaxID=6277 RepID=A0A498S3Z6_ACAVI|nr:unnamed protein product [Acanthocheilonema viteae]